MGKSRDRANRSGTDPINISDVRLSLEGSNDIKVTAQDGTTLKKVFAEELHVGTGDDRVILKRNSSDGKVQFQTTDGSTTTDTQVGTGVVTNPSDLPLTGNSAGDTKFVTSNNNLMIYNGTGWYKIATVTNSSPTISSAGNATYNFATDGTPIIVEITATDPEGLALQYKYQVTSGSLGSTATVTSSSTSGGTYSAINANTLTSNKYFKVTPSTNTAHAGTFSLTFSASDGINVANSSASSFTLQFSTYGSVFFDGTGDSLTTGTSSDLQLGSGDFTVEYWLYTSNFDSTGNVFDGRDAGVNNSIITNTNTSGQHRLWYVGGYRITSSAMYANEWYHIAIVRNSGVTTMYINGVAESTTWSDTTNFTGQKVTMGTEVDGVSSEFHGYISNFRMVVGTAQYTSNFSVPTSPLTAVGGTKLLTAHKNNEIVDGSGIGHTLTKNGDVTAHASNPFPIDTTGYGSLYFDGSGDYLSIPNSANFYNLGTADWTIEFWVYVSDLPDHRGVFSIGEDDGALCAMIYTDGKIKLVENNQAVVFESNSSLSINTWYHIAFTNDDSSNTQRLYINGIAQSNTGSKSTAFSYSNKTVYIGGRYYSGSFQKPFKGYISNFRVVGGSIAYTPSTAASGLDLVSQNTSISSHAGFDFGTDDFTVEFFFKWDSNSGYQTLIDHNYTSAGGFTIQSNASTYKWGLWGDVSQQYESTHATQGVWHHYAIVRNGNTVKMYRDGVETLSKSHSGSVGSTNSTTFGHGSYSVDGKISNFRVVKGTALYTSAGFTIPTSNLTAISGTSLLLFQENSGSTLSDGSTNNYTVNIGGNSGNILTSDGPFYGNITVPTSPLTAVTNTKLLTAQRPKPNAITNGSTQFTGANVQITTPASSDFTLGTGDFTVEGWFNWANLPGSGGSGNYIMDFGGNGLVMQFNGASSLGFWGGGGMGYVQGSVSLSTNTWYHIAWVRISGTGKMYINGVEKVSGSVSKDVTTNSMTMNGYHTGYSYGQNGVKYSDLRVVKGLGVYTGAFSPPTGSLTKTGGTYPNNTNRTDPTASQTVLLTHQDNSGSSVPADNSDSNHTLTKVGTISKGAGYGNVATDQSTNSYSVTINGNTRNARNWPFNYNG